MTENGTTDPVARLRGAMHATRPAPDARRRMIDGALSRRPRRRVGLLLVPVAAALALVLWLHHRPTPRPEQPVRPVAAPAAATVFEAHARPRAVKVGPSDVRLEPATRIRVASVDPAATVVVLDRGKASFSVNPLPRGSFRVRAGRLVVEVVGTRFSVAGEKQCQRVEVSEGRVRVSDGRSRVLLGRGESRLFCEERPAAVAAPLPGEAEVREAMRLVQGGDSRRVVELLSGYLDRNPGGAFEEEALFHLCLAHARLGERAQARRLAQTFIGRFPDSRRAGRLKRMFSDDGN